MIHILRWLVASLLLSACARPGLESGSSEPSPRKTQVFVMGMIHGAHRTSKLWGLDQVRETIRRIAPDVICPEIPPANWPGTLATWKAEHAVTDSRVRMFPEYTDVLLPLTDELDFAVEPSAGWTEEMASARRARLEAFESSEADAEARAAYAADEAWVAAWFEAHPAPHPDDDPFYIHSPAYDLRTKLELGPYEYHLNDVIGPPGGWTYINQEHLAHIRAAIDKHPGERILVTFGAGHKYWFLEALREMPDVELMDVRPFLPGAVSPLLGVREAATEEFLAGLDCLRAWWARSRGPALHAWQRIESMQAFDDQAERLDALRLTRASEASEFRDGPVLGPVQVVAHDLLGWHLRVEVHRCGDQPAQAEWLSATLREDHLGRPGGFAWTELKLPDWLVAQRRARP